MYDPFLRGRFSVGVRTVDADDAQRKLRFSCEIWYPADASHFGQDYASSKLDTYALPGSSQTRTQEAVRDAKPARGPYPLIVYSHGSARWQRRSATFLCTHLASHGYIVAALDHYETVTGSSAVSELGANRVADLSFLIGFMEHSQATSDLHVEPSRIGAVGYSLGGWTVLSAMESESRIRSVVAHAPAGSSKPRPGIFAGKLSLKWKREAPALFLAGASDVLTPLAGIEEMFKRAPRPKRSFALWKADHMHFLDAVEEEHETIRTMLWPEEMSWIATEMRPAEELCPGVKANAFANGLTLAHLDATLRWKDEARKWLGGDIHAELAAKEIAAYENAR